jgi:hypothetical protein
MFAGKYIIELQMNHSVRNTTLQANLSMVCNDSMMCMSMIMR